MLEVTGILVRLYGTKEFMTESGGYRSVPNALYREICIALERLESGKLKEEEIHNLCHNLPETVPLQDFARGCQRHMLKLYGECPFDL